MKLLTGATLGLLIAAAACSRSNKKQGIEPADAPRAASLEPSGDGGAPANPGKKIELGPPSAEVKPVPAAAAALVKVVRVARGLQRPVALEHAPGDRSGRLFVLEQHAGRIRILRGSTVDKKPFLDLSGRVSQGMEQGLLGLAFHPKFASNNKLYVNYTDRDGTTNVVEYRVSARDTDRVDPATARTILRIKQPFSNHNGGNLEFGPDGKLYVGTGDGGAGGDPLGSGQNRKSLLGKMLRLDVDAASPKPEIIQWGLRNPWRYAFDPKTNDFYIGDVGQNQWEEINVVRFADIENKNFGWNVLEATHCFSPPRNCKRQGMTLPVIEYRNPTVGCSVTGGEVYRGKVFPELAGVYFYGDYCTAIVRSFVWSAGQGVRAHWDWGLANKASPRITELSSFGVDADGELYILSLRGNVYKLVRRE